MLNNISKIHHESTLKNYLYSIKIIMLLKNIIELKLILL